MGVSGRAARRHFLFLLSSARQGGNTEILARLAAAALPAGTEPAWLDLAADPLPVFADPRPSPVMPEGRAAEALTATLEASDIVLVAPVYWYGLPAPAKLYLDHWSGWLDLPGMGFAEAMKAKSLWLITVRADPEPEVAAPVEAAQRMTAEWMGMRWGGALHGIGDAPGDVRADQAALTGAQRFFGAS